jgi:fatty acid synthase subunit beta
LDGVTDTVEEDLEDEELWEANDLKIYSTKDGISVFLPNFGAYKLTFILLGSDMRELKSSITRSLCDQISTLLIH